VVAWLVIGIGILGVLRWRGNEGWLSKASAIIEERAETAEEQRHRPAVWD
jgi:hypothetical protein